MFVITFEFRRHLKTFADAGMNEQDRNKYYEEFLMEDNLEPTTDVDKWVARAEREQAYFELQVPNRPMAQSHVTSLASAIEKFKCAFPTSPNPNPLEERDDQFLIADFFVAILNNAMATHAKIGKADAAKKRLADESVDLSQPSSSTQPPPLKRSKTLKQVLTEEEKL